MDTPSETSILWGGIFSSALARNVSLENNILTIASYHLYFSKYPSCLISCGGSIEVSVSLRGRAETRPQLYYTHAAATEEAAAL